MKPPAPPADLGVSHAGLWRGYMLAGLLAAGLVLPRPVHAYTLDELLSLPLERLLLLEISPMPVASVSTDGVPVRGGGSNGGRHAA